MAKLIARLDSNRVTRRGSEVHRLGDSWVCAEVANWSFEVSAYLDDEGMCEVQVRNIKTGVTHSLLHAVPVADLFSVGFMAEPPKSKKTRRGHRSRLLQEVLEELA